MSYPIIDIEGIGPTYAAKLRKVGIHTITDLLEMGSSKKGREKIAASTSIPESLVLTWVNHADLIRIDGIAAHFAELLEAAGVDSVKELALRNAEHLHTKLVQTNDQYGLSGKVPSRESLEAMVAQAKTMERKVTH